MESDSLRKTTSAGVSYERNLNSNDDNIKPKNVSSHLWEKFKALEKRTNEVTQRSTEKRIKHLQKQALDTVMKEFKSPEEQNVLRKHKVELTANNNEEKTASKRKAKQDISVPCEPSSSKSEDLQLHQLAEFMHVNDHLQLTDHSRPPQPTRLEQRMEAALKQGDMSTAETLSDHLATREMGEKIVSAFDAKRFVEDKKKEEESARARKKKKLNWGFEAKHRWETKGNM